MVVELGIKIDLSEYQKLSDYFKKVIDTRGILISNIGWITTLDN